MNEWHVNFYRKKHPKKCKKKITPLSNKIKKSSPDSEWMAHELFLGKKKYTTPIWDLNEWMAHQLLRYKKIRYLDSGYIFKTFFGIFNVFEKYFLVYSEVSSRYILYLFKVYSRYMWQIVGIFTKVVTLCLGEMCRMVFLRNASKCFFKRYSPNRFFLLQWCFEGFFRRNASKGFFRRNAPKVFFLREMRRRVFWRYMSKGFLWGNATKYFLRNASKHALLFFSGK